VAVAWTVGVLVQTPRDATGVLFVIAFFGVFVFAFTAVTRASAPVAPRAVAAGGIVGVVAGLGPAIVFMLWPPVPVSSGWAFAMVAAAGLGAAGLGARLGRLRLVDAVLAGLLAAVIAALLIGSVVMLMLQFGPEGWVPPMVSPALTPAARLGERRDLAGEPYLLVLLLGALLALLLGVLTLRARRRVRAASPVASVDGSRYIELGEV